MCVVARREEDNLRFETSCQRGEDLLKGIQVALIAYVRWEGHVHGRAVAALGAHLGGGPRARIVGELVRAEEEHTRIVIEDVLGAVAVVHVEVHDQHALNTMLLLCPARGDRHIGKYTEAHPVVDQRMMAGWADQRQAVFRLPPHHGVDQVEQAAGCSAAPLHRCRRSHRCRHPGARRRVR